MSRAKFNIKQRVWSDSSKGFTASIALVIFLVIAVVVFGAFGYIQYITRPDQNVQGIQKTEAVLNITQGLEGELKQINMDELEADFTALDKDLESL